MQLWKGRLHFVGGAEKDRWTPCADHWSIAIENGRAAEEDWRTETPIPVPGMHRGSVLLNDSLYVIGGQQGDFVAIAGDPEFTCTGETREDYIGECFRLDTPTGEWVRIADLPVAASHVDFSVLSHDGKILVVGGQIYKHPEEFYLRLTDAVQQFDPETGNWSIFGTLPYRLKIPCAGIRDDRLICVGGQRAVIGSDRPGPISADVLELTLKRRDQPVYAMPRPNRFAGKSILLVAHELSRTGAPLVLLETAQMLCRAGAHVRLVSADDKVRGFDLAAEYDVPVVPIESSFDLAAKADFVVANTLDQRTETWVRSCLEHVPGLLKRLLWWIHEIDVEFFRPNAGLVGKSAGVLFDSDAGRCSWANEIELPETHTINPAFSAAFMARVEKDLASGDGTAIRAGASRQMIRARLGVRPDDFLVTNIGTFETRKGQLLLSRTLGALASERKLPVKLLLIGFRSESRLRRFLLSRSLSEHRVLSRKRLFTATPDTGRYLVASDAFVMNTQGVDNRSGENFGRVTTEAMAYGVPVLGTSAGGTPEIIRHGETGLLFPVGEAGQAMLADQLEGLIGDRSYARALGLAGREHALKAYRPELFMKKLEALFDKF
ncbi:glycosyltransferase [Nitratireductor sp. XY-223]|uniref:glycosyltransferase n=1 Tax=Nitratireductor sp. XY-223 TaxID=2561926 RepID=UPI0010AB3CE3|nr:glycosyltransferase [Nitratireductor sp. XY-223]